MLTKRATKQRQLTLQIKKLLIKRDGLRKEITFLEAALKAGNNEISRRQSKTRDGNSSNNSQQEKELSICF